MSDSCPRLSLFLRYVVRDFRILAPMAHAVCLLLFLDFIVSSHFDAWGLLFCSKSIAPIWRWHFAPISRRSPDDISFISPFSALYATTPHPSFRDVAVYSSSFFFVAHQKPTVDYLSFFTETPLSRPRFFYPPPPPNSFFCTAFVSHLFFCSSVRTFYGPGFRHGLPLYSWAGSNVLVVAAHFLKDAGLRFPLFSSPNVDQMVQVPFLGSIEISAPGF